VRITTETTSIGLYRLICHSRWSRLFHAKDSYQQVLSGLGIVCISKQQL